MNASQRLWRRLATLLPDDQFNWLAEEHKRDLARDRRHSTYRQKQRQYGNALNRIGYSLNQEAAQHQAAQIYKWLNEHEDWNPDSRAARRA